MKCIQSFRTELFDNFVAFSNLRYLMIKLLTLRPPDSPYQGGVLMTMALLFKNVLDREYFTNKSNYIKEW